MLRHPRLDHSTSRLRLAFRLYTTYCRPLTRSLAAPHDISPSARRTFSTSTALRTTQQDDSEDFWAVPASDITFWNAYVSTRPNYSKDFYDIIYNHHAAHSATSSPEQSSSPTTSPKKIWSVAHDVGCGAGQVAAELTSQFTSIIASDNIAAHLDVARSRLSKQDGRITYTHSKGEDLANHHGGNKADLIAAAEAIVLMDQTAALSSFARVLKSGGTLACWFYGGPTFTSSPGLDRARCQELLNRIMVTSWRKVIRGSPEKRMRGFKRCADQMASWLDYLSFSPSIWSHVERHKWNTSHGTLAFFGEEACGFPVNPANNVSSADQLVEKEVDETFWRNEWDIEGLKEYFEVLFPGFRKVVNEEAAKEVARLFSELEQEMGGTGRKRGITWPASLVVATRK